MPDSPTRGPTPLSAAKCQIGAAIDLFVHELLDLVEQRRALLVVEFDGLLLEQLVDVGIAAVGVGRRP